MTAIRELIKSFTPRCVQELEHLVEHINNEAKTVVSSVKVNGVVLENIKSNQVKENIWQD